MSPVPDNIDQLRTRHAQEVDFYHPSSDEYGTADHTPELCWWSDPADTTERIAVFAIVTGVLVSDMMWKGGHDFSI
ncbi:uncharacterized protein FSUBG_3095 [Fusarium subglutinans]|uniref:Uncharacterized protein n=1 Tax=Gibberella subglutinans TaxID=42677 RepID=A0A8H5Q8A0_GIBSU|nr:uncharacterized protein FSUBG_3095 [Fusarium subglutinans]KAF5610479.1 hypothetical protein FSUBG_3095 [Fusarium subglutinans]